VRQADLARSLARRLGKPAFLPAPAPLLRLALGEMATALLASQRVVPRRLTAENFNFRYADIDSALAALLD
jgi:NAD dependent epimerase/dehydratase family enzyme